MIPSLMCGSPNALRAHLPLGGADLTDSLGSFVKSAAVVVIQSLSFFYYFFQLVF